jgi:hypothetical protein
LKACPIPIEAYRPLKKPPPSACGREGRRLKPEAIQDKFAGLALAYVGDGTPAPIPIGNASRCRSPPQALRGSRGRGFLFGGVAHSRRLKSVNFDVRIYLLTLLTGSVTTIA